jgi:hypothetical protein
MPNVMIKGQKYKVLLTSDIGFAKKAVMSKTTGQGSPGRNRTTYYEALQYKSGNWSKPRQLSRPKGYAWGSKQIQDLSMKKTTWSKPPKYKVLVKRLRMGK